jgi:ATP-binding cassette subfamily B protein RaxB
MRQKVPVIFQEEAAECGHACLAMILAFHGRDVGLAVLRRRIGSSVRGMSAEGLIAAAGEFGLLGRAARLEPQELDEITLPCILHVGFAHFVVLVKADGEVLTLHDPKVGLLTTSRDQLGQTFTGVAIEFSPCMNFASEDKPKGYPVANKFWAQSPFRRSLASVALLSLVIESLSLATPLFQQWVVDGVIATGDHDLLVSLFSAFLIASLMKCALGLLRDWAVARNAIQCQAQWMTGAVWHLLRLPLPYFDGRPAADIANRVVSTRTVCGLYSTATTSSVADLVLALVTVAALFIYSPVLASIVVFSLLLQISLRVSMLRQSQQPENASVVQEGRESTHLLETIRAIRAIKALNVEEGRRDHWLRLMQASNDSRLRTTYVQSITSGVGATLTSLEYAVVMLLGARAVLKQEFTVGALFAFLMFRGQFSQHAIRLVDSLLKFKLVGPHKARMAEMLETVPEFDDQASKFAPPLLESTVEFRKVSFRYSKDGPWLLRDCSFSITAGERLVIAGPSGGGKSTIIKIILGFLQPTDGEVLIGGKSIRQIGLRECRSMCAAVQQDDFVFAGTVEENITIFDSEVPSQKVASAARLAGVHASVMSLPMGYSTFVGDMGKLLSGGERQRLLLARAFLRDSPILLLDEATSSLDSRAEALVCDSIKKLKKTCLIVAHRDQAIRLGDRVAYLSNGFLKFEERENMQMSEDNL